MTRDQFDWGMEYLKQAFPNTHKSTFFADLVFSEVSSCREDDYRLAVLDLSDGVRFPNKGEIKKAISKIYELRISREWQAKKAEEYKQVQEIMAGPEGDGIMQENLRNVKSIMSAVRLGREATDALAVEFRKKYPPCSTDCTCIDGLVEISHIHDGHIYTYVKSCIVCKTGPKSYGYTYPPTKEPAGGGVDDKLPF